MSDHRDGLRDALDDLLTTTWGQAPVGVAVFDADRRFVWINDELARMNGRPAEAHLGRLLEEVLPASAVADIRPLMDRAARERVTIGPAALAGPAELPPLAQNHVDATYVPLGEGEAVAAFIVGTTEAVRTRQRLEVLQAVGAALASARTVVEVIGAVLDEAVPAMRAAAGAIGIRDGEHLQVRTVGLDRALLHRVAGPEVSEDADEWVRVPLANDWPLCASVGDNRVLVFESVRSAATAFPDIERLDPFTGWEAFVTAPLPGTDGTPIGMIEFHWPTVRRISDDELELVLALAALAAQALVRAHLHEAEVARSARHELRRRLAEELATARSPQEVAAVVASTGLEAVGATGGAIYALAAEGTALRSIGVRTSDPELAEQWERVLLSTSAPVCDVLHHGAASLQPDAAAITAEYPHLVADAQRAGAVAWATFPLRVAGEAWGSLTFSFAEPQRFQGSRLLNIESVVQLVEDALDRATESELDHRIAMQLQRRLMMRPPDVVPGFHVAGSYRPAEASVAAGGDWFETIALPDGGLAAVVGDVVGHGLAATAAMSDVRSAVGALVTADPEPEALAPRLGAAAARVEGAYCATLVYARISPRGEVRLVRMGHPPPLMVAAGRTVFLQDAAWPPLGVEGLGAPFTTTVIPPGGRLVLYTDGLVERRGEAVTTGLARLADAAMAIDEADVQRFCDRLMAVLVTGARDDVAVLCIERVSSRPSAGRGRSRPIRSPTPTTAPCVRRSPPTTRWTPAPRRIRTAPPTTSGRATPSPSPTPAPDGGRGLPVVTHDAPLRGPDAPEPSPTRAVPPGTPRA